MRFVLRRLGFFALTLWVAITLNFLLPRTAPQLRELLPGHDAACHAARADQATEASR